jgi:amino acid transporter
MIGAGIFSLLGVAAEVGGQNIYQAFIIASLVALPCAYSYARLGATFPSAGGPVEFLLQTLGDRTVTGAINLLLWLGYVFALALYARAFGGYASAMLGLDGNPWAVRLFGSGLIALFVGLNALGSGAVGRVEIVIVAIKLSILVLFAVLGLFLADSNPFVAVAGPQKPFSALLYTAGIVFLAFEGFGLITNAAGDMRDPQRTLPRALYLSILIALAVYVLVCLAVAGNLTPTQVIEAKEYALARAAEPFLGRVGFVVMASAALLSTASAVNATLFGGAQVSYRMAQVGELPKAIERNVWREGREGLFITAAGVLILANLFDLSGIAMMGSSAFLIIYGVVSAAHIRIRKRTGARLWVLLVAVVGCVASLAVLTTYMWKNERLSLWVLLALIAGCFVVELLWRRVGKRAMKAFGEPRAEEVGPSQDAR